jgi:Putative adhesin
MQTITTRARFARLVVPLVFLSAAAAGCDIAMAHLNEKETAEWRRTYELQPGGRVEISNVNGKIDVQPSTGNTVEVVAEKTARAGSSDAAKEALGRIQIVETVSPASVRIETKVQKADGGLMNRGSQQVHYTVKVPAGAEVNFRTVNGGIELSGLKGRINAETTNGGIKAHEVSGYIDASTTNGGVEVELAQLSDAGVKLGCTNGGIDLRLPATSKATISARITNGGIDTSGLEIETSGEKSRRRLDGRLNGGGARIELEGTNGGIHIAGR